MEDKNTAEQMTSDPSEELTKAVENDMESSQSDTAKESEEQKKETPANKAKDDVETLKASLAEANDKYLRMLAEYDNFRRRSAKERESLWTEAVADTIKEILPIADNLERATTAEGDAEVIRQGLTMTHKSLSEMLVKLGMERFGEVGQDFDPALHNAVMHIDDENLGENKIAEVFQCGYRIGEKVVRFAMVKVAN